MNTLTFEGNTYWLIEVDSPVWFTHQREPYPNMGGTRLSIYNEVPNLKGQPYKYNSLQINGKYYAFKHIEEVESKSLGDIMAENNWTGDQIQKTIEANSDYYKKIIKESIPYLQTYLNVMTNIGKNGLAFNQKPLTTIIQRFKSESYGA